MRLPSVRSLALLAGTAVAAAFLAPSLAAQGGPEDQPKTPVKPASSQRPMSREEIEQLVDDRIAEDRQKRGLALSYAGLNLKLGGTIEIEYRSAQENHRGGSQRAPDRSVYGLDFDAATFFVEASFPDRAGGSSLSICDTHFEIEATPSSAYIDEAWLMFNRPVTRFAAPAARSPVTDSLLVGLDEPFWTNDHTVIETYSLMQQALGQDEKVQALYTITALESLYFIGGASGGLRDALAGSVDETNNYPIMQDDRESFFTGRASRGQTARTVEWDAGMGAVIGLHGRGPVISAKTPFRAWDPQANSDVLHIGLWYMNHTLSASEQTLIDSALGRVTGSSTKWRAGANIDFNWAFGNHVLFTHCEFASAADGGLDRTFIGAEASIAFAMAGTTPLIRTVQPFIRYGEVHSNAKSPVLGPATAVGSAASDGAYVAADRTQLTAGLRLGLHDFIAIIFEYTRNEESFNTPSGAVQGVDNNLFLINLRAGW
jgi:hypothetical protein